MSPAYPTSIGFPFIMTAIGVTILANGSTAGAWTPLATDGLVAPRPLKKMLTTSPGTAGEAGVTLLWSACCAVAWPSAVD
jgi:hypothetical protein